MRSYCAIYVDAGYLYASAATRVIGTSLRSGVKVDNQALLQGLIAQAEADSGLPLLRVNWYDSGARPGGMPDIHQDEIGMMPRVKLRLGRLSRAGEQKGVDLRIGLDLVTHGRNRIVDVIYLVSGDDDLTEAVEEAQGHGVQIIVMAVPAEGGKPHAVARHLRREADGVILIDPQTIDSTVKPAAIPAELIPEESTGEAAVDGEAGARALDGEPAAEVASEESPIADADQPTTGAVPAGAAVDLAVDLPRSADVAEESPAAAMSPSPASVFAARKPSAVVPPRAVPPRVLWSTRTGHDGHGPDHGEVSPDLIDQVVRQVVDSWCQTATPQSLVALRAAKPFIPSDIDRTLLIDLASHIDASVDLDDTSRYALRDRFWDHIDRVKLT
jgi:uncharacterized LabA/DUF88 family protein